MSTSTTERAREAAGTAADQTQQVADVAREEASEVVTEAKEQAQEVLGQAMSQVREQSVQQRDRLVETLQSLGSDLQAMASQSGVSGLAADLSRELADRCRTLGSKIDGREPQEILDDVRSFARQRPGTFLLGALAAGVVAGRIVRSAKAGSSGSTGAATSSVSGTPTQSTAPSTSVGAQASVGAPDPMGSTSTPGQRTQDSPATPGAGEGGSPS